MMADPVGTWQINGNGFKGTMNITSDGAGHLSGMIDFAVGATDTLQGTWNEAAQEIVFKRTSKVGGNIVATQTWTGYLYLTKEPLFTGQGSREPNPDTRLLTGYFHAPGVGGSTPARPYFGWVARQSL